jgi:hypothetical protein
VPPVYPLFTPPTRVSAPTPTLSSSLISIMADLSSVVTPFIPIILLPSFTALYHVAIPTSLPIHSLF